MKQTNKNLYIQINTTCGLLINLFLYYFNTVCVCLCVESSNYIFFLCVFLIYFFLIYAILFLLFKNFFPPLILCNKKDSMKQNKKNF